MQSTEEIIGFEGKAIEITQPEQKRENTLKIMKRGSETCETITK